MESKQFYLINKHREAAKMRRQRNMAQMKEQMKTPEKELNEMEISNLSDAEFKTLVIRMLKELSEDLYSIKKIKSDMKDALIEIKNNLRVNNSRVDKAENQINNLEHKETKKQPIRTTRKKETKKSNQDSASRLWDKFKRSNVRIRGARRRERESKKLEIYLKK